MKKNKLLLCLFSLLLGIFYCCSDERQSFDIPSSSKEKMVTFSVRVPGAGPKTYALTEKEENEVKSIAILLFDNTSNMRLAGYDLNFDNNGNLDNRMNCSSIPYKVVL